MNILETLEYAQKMHGMTNALDKTGTTPYYWHLLRVMLRIKDPTEDQMKIAILHDVLEDTPATEADLRKLFGNHVTDNVIWCSKNFFQELSFKQWMTKIGLEAPEDAIIAKLADISDNLGFERMRGLMPVSKPHSFSYLPRINANVQQRVDSITRKKMKLRGEMGVFDRYYIGWNLIMENPKNHALIEKVETTDFINFNQLKNLSQYIPQEELLNYFSINKLNTWKISGETKLHYDKNKQPYIAVEIEENIGKIYQSFLASHVDLEYIKNQKNRDEEKFHITLVNAADMGKMRKTLSPEEVVNVINQFKDIKSEFFSYGIGKNSKAESTAYYAVLENAYINTLRSSLGLNNHDLHMTLGFLPKDVHGVKKNKSTIEFSNEDLWKYFVECNFAHEKKSTPKIKF